MPSSQFGGRWTEEKLACLRKYLKAYVMALKNQAFETYYLDAFAGAGHRLDPNQQVSYRQEDQQNIQVFHEGSARIALQVEPPFDHYIFVDKDRAQVQQLEQLKSEFAGLHTDIQIHQAEANEFILNFCRTFAQNPINRGVIFLDPYGMQVNWSTIEAIADTQKLDLWYLFPLGMGVNRLLHKDGNIPDARRQALTRIFGDENWFDEIYRPSGQLNLFGEEEVEKKDTEAIKQYILKRLRSRFAAVADNPLVLRNSNNSPLYLFCFAVSNPSKKARNLALKIAEHILNADK